MRRRKKEQKDERVTMKEEGNDIFKNLKHGEGFILFVGLI